MGVNSLPRTITRQRRSCDLNTDPSAPDRVQHANHSATDPPREPVLCQLYRHTFVPYDDVQRDPVCTRRHGSRVNRSLGSASGTGVGSIR